MIDKKRQYLYSPALFSIWKFLFPNLFQEVETECGKRNYFPFKRKTTPHFSIFSCEMERGSGKTRTHATIYHLNTVGYIPPYSTTYRGMRTVLSIFAYLSVLPVLPIFTKLFRSPVSSSHISPGFTTTMPCLSLP